MARFLENTSIYTFESIEDDEVHVIAAYTLTGAFNIADRLFRHKEYRLVKSVALGKGGIL